MIVFDFDGIIAEQSRGEKLWRWITKKTGIKTPRIFLDIQEIVEFIFNIKPATDREILKLIKRQILLGNDIGLFTDRSLWSINLFLNSKKEKEIDLDLIDFNFIQTRKSWLNRFSGLSNLAYRLKNPLICLSDQIKPNADFSNLKNFAASQDLLTKDILVIDDLLSFLQAAKTNGFCTVYFPNH